MQILEAIGTRLKSFAAGADERLLFMVTEVKATKRSKTITGLALVADDSRRIEMTVDDELFKIAERAKSLNSALQCLGRLRRRPDNGRYEVLQPHDFQIVHSEDPSLEVLRRKIPPGSVSPAQMPLIREQP